MDSVGFEEYRRVQRISASCESGGVSKEEILRWLEDAEGSAEEA